MAYGSRLYQITKCMDSLAHIQDYLSNPREPFDQPLINLLGQVDQLEELHRLLYEEEPDGQEHKSNVVE